MPVLFRLPTLAKALGVPYFPVTANLLTMGPLGIVMPFPAKFKLRVLDPVTFDVPPDQERYSKSRIMEEAEKHPDAAAGGRLRHAARSPQRLVRLRPVPWAVASSSPEPTPSGVGGWSQALEADADMEVILGMGARTPSVPFERAEFVRADQNYSILNRIVKATQVDTILHTFMVTNSATVPNRALHEINVIGTMNLLAAAGAAGSSVRHIVVKSSTLVYGSSARDPTTFHEDTPRSGPAKNSIERALIEAEGLVRDFSEDNPATLVTVLRFANVLGTHLTTPISRNLSRPLCPSIFGFDPLLQFVEEDDVVRALLHVTRGGIPGLYNVAGDGRLPWSEVASHLRHAAVAALPLQPAEDPARWPAVRPAGRTGRPLALRAGRRHPPLRRPPASTYQATSAGAVESFIRALRLRRGAGKTPSSYTYEHDVEQFFRHSPSVTGTSDH